MYHAELQRGHRPGNSNCNTKIIERLRPKYGRMYNFDDAQPFNVRLMAMDMQVTMSNR